MTNNSKTTCLLFRIRVSKIQSTKKEEPVRNTISGENRDQLDGIVWLSPPQYHQKTRIDSFKSYIKTYYFFVHILWFNFFFFFSSAKISVCLLRYPWIYFVVDFKISFSISQRNCNFSRVFFI